MLDRLRNALEKGVVERRGGEGRREGRSSRSKSLGSELRSSLGSSSTRSLVLRF